MPETLLSGVVAAAFALTHIFGAQMRFLQVTPRSIWLSIAGGVSVAYVFVHLLPELAGREEEFRRELQQAEAPFAGAETHLWLIALAGLAVFYGLDRLARQSARGAERSGGACKPPYAVFWIHLGSFAFYNLIIGYLLVHREEDGGLSELALYGFALALHFLVNDQGLREQHGHTYHREGRWILAAAPVAGFALGLAATVPEMLISALFAFLAGGIVLNVLKEELPEDRESRFWAFAAGTAGYAALLLALG